MGARWVEACQTESRHKQVINLNILCLKKPQLHSYKVITHHLIGFFPAGFVSVHVVIKVEY